jgi:hypothetical protein
LGEESLGWSAIIVRKLFIYVEGPTEERFVKTLLVPHLQTCGIYCQPIVATTKAVFEQPVFKGGAPKYHKARKEIWKLLKDKTAVAVTTMLDYYGLDSSYPGRSNPSGNNCYDRVVSVEEAIQNDIGNSKFIPFLTLHEFEGLLFSSPQLMAAALPGGNNLETVFESIRKQFQTPEEINDQKPTAPHQRIINAYPSYQKPLHGSQIAARIGIEGIRTQCPHFDDWLRKMENLGK